MKSVITAILLCAVCTTVALAQDPNGKPADADAVADIPPTILAAPATSGPVVIPDARAMASDQEVGQARRAYRASCSRHESAAFCECVTAGVAQALAPSDLRLAARTIGERINAEGDAPAATGSDTDALREAPASRIESIEAHYADACSQFRSRS